MTHLLALQTGPMIRFSNALMLLIFTFIDALDNPVYGFFSDRTRATF
jgi:Na+/melibiose symporter-like transporter